MKTRKPDSKKWTQKKTAKPAKKGLGNRYARHSKLSEYKFLQVLRGFADNVASRDLSKDRRLSEKSIQALYRKMRLQMLKGMLIFPYEFGGAGFFMFENGDLTKRGNALIEEVQKSRYHQGRLEYHKLRFHDPNEATSFAIESVVRMFCEVQLSKNPVTLYPERTREALKQLQEISAFLKANASNQTFLDRYGDVYQRYERVAAGMKKLLWEEELLALRDKSVMHRYPNDLIYNDMKRLLREYPLGQEK